MKKLIVTVFSLYAILAIVVSIIHILFEYNHIHNQISQDLRAIYTSSSNPLATAIWHFNDEQINNLVDGLVTLNFISGVKIYENTDDLNLSKGTVDSLSAITFEGDVIYFDGKINHSLGKIKIYSNQSVIIDRIKVNVMFIIANALIKTLALSLIIFFVGYKLIGSRLNNLSNAVQKLKFENVDDIKESKINIDQNNRQEKDEITDLITAYNKTLDNLSVRTLQRDTARNKLEKRNFNLKKLVDKKTLALRRKVSELNLANEKLEQLASFDPLTNLLNRRYFYERVEIEISRLRRNNKQAAILIVDVDFFKSVNDRYGHSAGDTVLIVISKLLKENVRKDDLVARFGGEEFVIFMADINTDAAINLAERMRKSIEQQDIIFEGEIIKITASCGLSILASDSYDIHMAINHADKLLYQAKESGRNNLKYPDEVVN